MSLELWTPLHDNSAQDYSGNGNHGTLNGGVTTGVAGKGGLEAMSFDGSDDYVETANLTSMGFSDGDDISVSFWVYIPDTIISGSSNDPFFSNYDGSTAVVISGNNDYFRFQLKGTDENWRRTIVPKGDVSAGWSHFVGVCESGELLELHHNGQVYKNDDTGAGAIGTADLTQSEPVDLAAETYSGNYAPVNLVDVRVYRRALNDAEIRQLYEMGGAMGQPTDGVSRYRLDGDAVDSWGSNDGTTNGGLAFSDDAVYGQSADFDGTDDYIGTPTTIASGKSQYSFSAWFYPTDGASLEQTLVQIGDSGGGVPRSFLQWRGDALSAYMEDGNNSVNLIGDTLPTDTWMHGVFVRDGNELISYHNGSLYDQGSASVSDTTDGDTIEIGRAEEGTHYFSGRIDDVRIYPYALQPDQVRAIYNASSEVARPATDGVSRYSMNGDATDSWGSNDGTENGGPVYSSNAIRGQSVNLDGTDDIIKTGLNPIPVPFTISAWVNANSSMEGTSGNHIISNYTNSSDDVYFDYLSNGNLAYQFDPAGRVEETIATDSWIHITMVVSTNSLEAYKNAEFVGSQSHSHSSDVDSGSDLWFGADASDGSGGNHFSDVLLDDVRIYDYALSPSEVHDLYQWGTRGTDLRKHLVMK